MRVKQVFGQHHRHFLTRIGIVSLHGHIIDLRAYAQCRIRRQCPRSCGPCQEIRSAPLRHFRFRILHSELGHHGKVLHISVTSRLIQLVRTEPRPCRRRIRLYGISLIQQSLLVELLQKPPERFDITVVVSNVRIVEVHPISHLVSQVSPFLRELHHVRTAMLVIISHRNRLSDVLLRNAESLFHTQLHGKSVRVPSGLTLHLISFHGLVATESILDGTRHHVVDARHTVCRGRTFIKHKRRTPFTFRHTLGEHIVFIPFFQHFLVHLGKVELGIFSKFLAHIVDFIRCQNLPGIPPII